MIGQSKYLTTLDLAKGYWQVTMVKEDKAKTAFSNSLGVLQFTIMPFRLSGALAFFSTTYEPGGQGNRNLRRSLPG